jgi:NAD(P)-dependent dehydrogenase (short-subunit alcohol dehydrogenase family)
VLSPGRAFARRCAGRGDGGEEKILHIRQLFDLSGKVAVVTGGSRGLGLEIAEGLAEAGARLAITARRRQWLDPAEQHLAGLGADVLTVEADVADPEGVRRTVDDTVSRFGGIDILVNNAGLSWGAPSLEFPLDKWELVLGVNLTGVWLMSQAVAPRMIERGGGKIVNVSSITAQLGIEPELQDTVSYNASKGGVDALTRDLAVKWARHGITVNAVEDDGLPRAHRGGSHAAAVPSAAPGARGRAEGRGGLPGFARRRLHHRPGAGGGRRRDRVVARRRPCTHSHTRCATPS